MYVLYVHSLNKVNVMAFLLKVRGYPKMQNYQKLLKDPFRRVYVSFYTFTLVFTVVKELNEEHMYLFTVTPRGAIIHLTVRNSKRHAFL